MNPYICAILALSLLSTISTVIKLIDINPVMLGLLRLSIASAVFILISSKKPLRIFTYKKELKYLLLLGLFFGLHWLTYFYSIYISSASIGVIGVSTFGIHLTLLSILILKIRPKKIDFFAVLLAVTGCILLSLKGQKVNLYGLALSVFSGFCYACLPVIHKKIKNIPTIDRTLSQFLFALVIFIPFSFSLDWNLTFWNLSYREILGVLYLSLLCTVLGHTLWIKATTELNPLATSVMHYIGVPFALSMNFFVLNESFDLKAIIGISMIYTGNIIAFVWGSALKAK